MRLLYLVLFLTFFALGTSSAAATGPRDCDYDGTPCETYSDPYWDKPADPAPTGVGGGSAPTAAPVKAATKPVSATKPAPTAEAVAVAAEVTPPAPVEPAAAPQPAQVASSQSSPAEPPQSNQPPVWLLLVGGMLTGALLLRFAQ